MSEEEEKKAPPPLPPPPQLFSPLPKMEAKLQRPSGSAKEQEKTERQLQELGALLDQSYSERGTDMVTCTWQHEKGVALVDKPQHKHVTVMGTIGKPKELFPEEVLFLCSLGCARFVPLQLKSDDDKEESREEKEVNGSDVIKYNKNLEMNKLAWELSLSTGMKLNNYVTYSYLKRLGYVVRRFGTTTPPATQPPVDMIAYEVWKPEGKAKFRKVPPDFYLVVCGMDDPFPGADVLGTLAKWCQPRELKIAIVSTGDVAFITAGQGI